MSACVYAGVDAEAQSARIYVGVDEEEWLYSVRRPRRKKKRGRAHDEQHLPAYTQV